MRLINTETLEMEEFYRKIPPYVILSHTWGPDNEELTFRNVEDGEIDKPGIGSIKLRGCCRQAREDGYGFAWIDTCCIDKMNHVELGEAINSMFRWYKQASLCYVYLSDVPGDDNPRESGSKFRSNRWFRRGWTLQELLAPMHLRFYSSEWRFLGTKGELSIIIESITGVPRPVLVGITELHAVSIAQRMSWAAQRDTKREEDLAYCLLGIFGVTMSMIYGEGGAQAFLRLQEQIMRTTRDDSILAWGIGAKESSTSDSAQVTPGRILAIAPSNFANSRHIVSRHQFTAPIYSMELTGGGLRVSLPVHVTPAGKTVGLLRCGPEHDIKQVVGIPLVQTASEGVNEYIRPGGSAAVLQPTPAQDASPKLVHIRNDSHGSNMTTDEGQRYLLYDEFADMGLELFEVVPGSCWEKSRALVVLPANSGSRAPRQCLFRFRHSKYPVASHPPDFVIAFRLQERGSSIQAQYCVMICDRSTSLGDLASQSEYVVQGTMSASNGLLHLSVMLEPTVGQPFFTIRPEALPGPPDETHNASAKLRKLDLALELAGRLEEEEISSAEREEVMKRLREKTSRVEQIRQERQAVERELEILEEKRRTLVEEERNGAREVHQLEERQTELMQDQGSLLIGRLPIQHLWSELSRAKTDSFEGRTNLDRDTLLRWAVQNNCIDVIRVILDKDAITGANTTSDGQRGHTADRPERDLEAKDSLGWTLLLVAARNGYENATRLLLDRGAAIEAKDRAGGTSLTWAASKGHKAVAQLLLDRGAAIEAEDQEGWTPLLWATLKGHEAVVRLLLDRGAAVEMKDQKGRTPLLWATSKGHETIVRLLLDRGAAIEAKDRWGGRPLLCAAAIGHEAIVRLLLDRGAAVETEDQEGQTPLSRAAANGHEAVAQLLRIHTAPATRIRKKR